MADNRVQQIIGDISVNAVEERIKHTPVNDVVWSGNRGQSKCYPIDKECMELLQQYGQNYVAYDWTGEPNFKCFEITHVQISDMSGDRSKNFQSVYKRLLKEEWAKENGITTIGECKDFLQQNELTLHECSDGVTIRVVPAQIHKMFGHAGGVSENRAMEAKDVADGFTRNIGRTVGETKIKFNKTAVSIQQTFTDAIEENSVAKAGFHAVEDAELELLYIGVQNIMAVLNEEKTKGEAVKDTAMAVGGIAATGMIDELVFGGTGVATQIAGVAFVMKDSFMKYIHSEIDEREFVKEVTQKGVPMLVGKVVGMATGGNIIAQILATYAATAIYNEIQVILCDYKSISTMQEEYISRLRRISYQMIEELQMQRYYLRTVFVQNAIVWNASIDEGFDCIDTGAIQGDMQMVTVGMNKILGLFDSEVRFKDSSEVKNFFESSERVFRL